MSLKTGAGEARVDHSEKLVCKPLLTGRRVCGCAALPHNISVRVFLAARTVTFEIPGNMEDGRTSAGLYIAQLSISIRIS